MFMTLFRSALVTIIYAHLIALMMVQEPEAMTFEDLSSVYRVESKSPALSEVRKDLYQAMVRLYEKAQKDHDTELAKDPDSIMCEGFSERRKKVTSLSLKIVDLRMEKVMIMALRTSMGAPAVLDKLTPEEREYYSHIAALSEKHRSLILKDAKSRRYVIPDISNAVAVAVAASDVAAADEIPDAGPAPDDTAGNLIAGAVTDIEAQSASADDDFVVIRILEDLPPIAGPEFDYDLKKEDVIRMPSSLANALINHEKAVAFKL
jgi:DNA replication factor GINS